MERAEARARLMKSTRFQFVGERLAVRNVAILQDIQAAERVEEENGVNVAGAAFVAQGYDLAAA